MIDNDTAGGELDEEKVSAAERTQRLALLQAERLGVVSDKAQEQGIKVSSWLSASLLAVNSGGAITALQAIDKLQLPWLPIALFGVGILLSMACGVMIQLIITKTVARFERALQITQEIAVGIELDDAKFRELCRVAKPIRRTWVAPLIGWLSAVAFTTGGFALVADLSRQKATSTVAKLDADKPATNSSQGPK